MGWIDNRDMRDNGYEGPLAKEVVDGLRPSVKTKREAEESMLRIMNDDLSEYERRVKSWKSEIDGLEKKILIHEDKIEQIEKRLKEI